MRLAISKTKMISSTTKKNIPACFSVGFIKAERKLFEDDGIPVTAAPVKGEVDPAVEVETGEEGGASVAAAVLTGVQLGRWLTTGA